MGAPTKEANNDIWETQFAHYRVVHRAENEPLRDPDVIVGIGIINLCLSIYILQA